jgi:hypothetical protein
MALKTPSQLPATVAMIDPATGYPTPFFLRYFNENVVATVASLTSAANAQAAADAANAAAAAADAAAASVTAATDLANSYPQGASISASDAGADVTVTISAHTRVYAGGTTVAVDGGVLTGLLYNTNYWIAYDQASRSGGIVPYVAYLTTQGNAVNDPDRHFVGALQTPEAGGLDEDGVISLPPGGVNPRNLDGGELP